MIEKVYIKKTCFICKNEANFKIKFNKKEFTICKNCLNNLYSEIGGYILPKSPKSILTKDNRIKNERF